MRATLAQLEAAVNAVTAEEALASASAADAARQPWATWRRTHRCPSHLALFSPSDSPPMHALGMACRHSGDSLAAAQTAENAGHLCSERLRRRRPFWDTKGSGSQQH